MDIAVNTGTENGRKAFLGTKTDMELERNVENSAVNPEVIENVNPKTNLDENLKTNSETNSKENSEENLKGSLNAVLEAEECGCHQKATPREAQELKLLKNRLNRMAGQLNGIGKMLDENRYCGDILTQVAAVESALQSFGYLILQEHMETCMVEEIGKGNTAVIAEAVELVKKLK